MSSINLKKIGDAQKKPAVVDVRSGDTVKVTQKIKEGDKFRLQVFEGVVIRTDRKDSHTARITVRKIASGIGVEKSFLIHNPLVEKIEIVRRAKVRRKNLSYLRERSGKSARLTSKAFDRVAVNNLTAKIEEKTTNLAQEAEGRVETMETDAKKVVEDIKKTAGDVAEAAKEKAADFKDKAADVASDLKEKATDAKEAAEKKFDEAKDKASNIKNDVKKDIKD